MRITRPEPKLKPYRDKKGNDMVQIFPFKSGKLFLIELDIPDIGTKYRIIEGGIDPDSEVKGQTALVLNKFGLSSKKLKLFKKGQPYNFGEYAQDLAVYVFIAEEAEVIAKPILDIHVPYEVKSFSLDLVQNMLKNRQIENQTSTCSIKELMQ